MGRALGSLSWELWTLTAPLAHPAIWASGSNRTVMLSFNRGLRETGCGMLGPR